MVRGLTQWTKTLSFPSRISPQRQAKEGKIQVSPSVSPTTSPPSPVSTENLLADKAPVINDHEVITLIHIIDNLKRNYNIL